MIICVDFNLLNTFDCVYGRFEKKGDSLRVYVIGGLALPYSNVVEFGGGYKLIESNARSSNAESYFPRHYLYDSSKGKEYVAWDFADGVLVADTVDGDRFEYSSKSKHFHGLNEYVGDCWFVFEGLALAERKTSEYAPDRKISTGNKDVCVWEGGSTSVAPKEYFLEGVLEEAPGPGWMSCKIFAESFYIEF